MVLRSLPRTLSLLWQADAGKVSFNHRVHAVVQFVQSRSSRNRMSPLRIFRQKDIGESAFYDSLVEDNTSKQPSYVDFLCSMHRHIQKS